MKYTIQAFNAGTFWVPGPEVYWMEAWNQREEMNALIYLVRGGGQNILINTGPPQDLTIINEAWVNFFGYPEAQIVRAEEQRPQNILRSQGLSPDDISLVIVTPLQAYATANIHLFRNATICISRRGWIEDFQAPFYHLHGSFCGCTRRRFVDAGAVENAFRCLRANWCWRCYAHYDGSLFAPFPIHNKNDTGIRERPVKALLLAIFLIGGARTLFRRGDEDLGNNLAGLKGSFAHQTLFRWNVEIAHVLDLGFDQGLHSRFIPVFELVYIQLCRHF